MRDPVQLRLECAVQHPLAMAVEIDPDRRDAVEITTALGVVQIDTLSAFNDEGIAFDPVALLGEGVPEVSAILGLKPLGAGFAGHAGEAIIGNAFRFDNQRENYYNQRA